MRLWLKVLLVTMPAVVIGYCSLRGSPYLAELPFMPAWLGDWLDSHQDVRHLAGYAGLTFVTMLMFRLGRPARHRAVVLVGVAMVAAVLEAAQLFLPNRHADWLDAAWSWVGVVVGGGFARLARRLMFPVPLPTSNPAAKSSPDHGPS